MNIHMSGEESAPPLRVSAAQCYLLTVKPGLQQGSKLLIGESHVHQGLVGSTVALRALLSLLAHDVSQRHHGPRCRRHG